jgi:hypothetical protein
MDAKNDYKHMTLWPGGIFGYFQDNPAILSVEPPGRFAIRLFSENKRGSFAYAPVGGPHCVVHEVERIDYVPPPAKRPERVNPPERPLKYLGEVALETAVDDKSSFRTIRDFTFGNDGNIYAWRCTDDGTNALLTVNAENGTVLAERPFQNVKARFNIHWADMPRIGVDRFVVMRRSDNNRKGNVLYEIDLVSGVERPMAVQFEEGGHAKGFSRFADGGFVVLDTWTERHSPVCRLSCYDPQGARLWQMRSDDPAYSDILGPNARSVAIIGDKSIALLTSEGIHFLNRDGEHLDTFDLAAAFEGARPSLRGRVVADANGGCIFGVWRNHPPVVVRVSANGALRNRFSARHADGKTFDTLPVVRVDPRGRLWTSDGASFMRLTDDGVVDLLLGETPTPTQLVGIAAFTADRQGRLHAVAEGAGAVHIFDSTGRLLHICQPAQEDFDRSVIYAFVAATDDGEVFVQRPYKPDSQRDEYVRFSATGERIGVSSFDPWLNTRIDSGPVWLFQPGTGHRCGFRREEILIVDDNGTVIRRIERRPNGKWIPNMSLSLSLAPDGSLAVLVPDYQDNQRAYAVDLYTAEGDPVCTVGLPRPADRFSGLAYDGRRVVVAGNREVVIVDLDADHTSRWSLTEPGVAAGPWRAYMIEEGRELLLFDRHSQRIHRYELP